MKRIQFFVSAYLLLRLLLQLLNIRSPFLWGLDYPSYIDNPLVFVLLLLPFLAFVRTSYSWISPSGKKRRNFGARNLWIIAAIGVVVALLIFILPEPFPFLGDGAMYRSEIYRIIYSDELQSSLIKPTSFITGYALTLFTSTFKPHVFTLPYMVIGGISFLIQIAATLYYVRSFSHKAGFLFLLFFLNAGLLMYFSYVELYALPFSLAASFFVASYFAVQNKLSPWIPGAFLLLACLSGLSAIIFLPAFVYLIMLRLREFTADADRRVFITIAAATAAAAILLYIVLPGILSAVYFIPYTELSYTLPNGLTASNSYTLFSIHHLSDIVNSVLLIVPVAVITIAALMLSASRRKQRMSPELHFALLAVLGAVLMIVLGAKSFGLARDWDLITIPSLAITFLAFVLFMEHLDAKDALASRTLILLLLTAFTSASLWVWTNVDEEAASERFTDLVVANAAVVGPYNTYNGLENLRKYYTNRRMVDGLVSTIREMVQTPVYERESYLKYLDYILRMQDVNRRATEYDSLFVQIRKSKTAVRNGKANYYDEILTHAILSCYHHGHQQKAIDFAGRMRGQFGEWKEYPLITVFLEPTLPVDSSVVLVASAIDGNTTNPVILENGAHIYEQASRFRSASILYHQVLSIDRHGYPQVYLDLARVLYFHLDEKDSSRSILQACVKNCRATKQSREAQQILTDMFSEAESER